MAVAEDLPEDVIVNIFSRLPVNSLIRFTSVSKRLHSIILSDPKFAQSQLKAARQHKTLSRRLLVSTDARQLESLRLDHTPSFGEPSSVSKLSFPFQPQWSAFYGVGYLSATDDYKVLVASYSFREGELQVQVFSLRTHLWQRIEPPGGPGSDIELDLQGTLSNDALHWLNYSIDEDEIVSFDLAVQEFRRMRLPNFDHDGKSFSYLGVCGGCLCASRYLEGACDSIDFWVMKEYDVSDSWTILFSLKLSDPPELNSCSTEFLVVESSTVAANWTAEGFELIRIDHKEDEKLGQYMLKGNQICMIEYEESLLWISSYYPEQEKEQVKILETHQKASQS